MSILNKITHPLKNRRRLINKSNAWRIIDIITISTMVFATVALLALLYFYVRPVPTLDIKVPVANDKAQYYAGQEVSGIFFGEVYYQGRVEIVRDVFCKNYRGVIKTDSGDDIFRGASVPGKLEGTSRRIGNLPLDAPVGANCVIQFVNTYHIATPFGDRIISKAYYTQNFTIIAKPSNAPTDQGSNDANSGVGGALQEPSGVGGTKNTTNNTTNNTVNNPPAEPVQPPQQCTVDVLGIKLFCN